MGFLWAIPFVMFVRGCIRGLDPIVSQAHGAGETDATGKALARAVVITLALCGPTMAWHLGAEWGLRLLGQPVELLPMASDYVWAIMWGVPGMLLFFMQRAFLQAMGIMRPAAMVMLGCNLFNVPLNWVLMYGAFGFEGMGVVGWGGGAGGGWGGVEGRVGWGQALQLDRQTLVHSHLPSHNIFFFYSG